MIIFLLVYIILIMGSLYNPGSFSTHSEERRKYVWRKN